MDAEIARVHLKTQARPTHLWRGVWRVADPKITLASASSMLVGGALAAADGPLAWGWLLVTVFGIFCVEAAKNASGEVFDWDSGDDQAVAPEDRSPFSGGKRTMVDGLWTRRQAIGVAAAFYGLALASGLLVFLYREPKIAWLGLAGGLIAFFYHAPPVKLSYRGLGELAVGIVYGPLLCAGTYLVQRGAVPLEIVLAGIPLGIAIAAFLWINEVPDRRADEAAGKRTWVVRLGPERAARAFGWLVAVAYALVVALPLAGVRWGVLLGLAGLPHGMAASIRLLRSPENTRELIPAQGWTLLSFMLLSAGMAAGVLAAPLLR